MDRYSQDFIRGIGDIFEKSRLRALGPVLSENRTKTGDLEESSSSTQCFLSQVFLLLYIFCRNKGGLLALCETNVLVFLDLTVNRDILSAALGDDTRPDTATGETP